MAARIILAAAAYLVVLPVAAHAANASIESLFGPYLTPGTKIASFSDTNFSSVATERWTTWEAPMWTGAIKPETEADVATIVKIANAHGIGFMATTGGHGAGIGFSNVSGIDINLANLNSVSIDVDNNEITVGGGVVIGDVIEPLYEAGKAIPHGNEVCVGLIGATLGAGIGIGTGLYGLGIDSLKSVRLVTATGDMVTVSETEHPDLFWGLRGAGANFGIVTEATFELQDQENDGNTVIASFTFTSASNQSVIELYKSFDNSLPPELSLQLAVEYNATLGITFLQLYYFYFGPLDDVQPYLNEAYALGPLQNSTTVVSQPALYTGLGAGECGINEPINGGTIGLGQTDVASIQAALADLVSFSEIHPTTFIGETIFQRYDNTVQLSKPAGETSFPWRDIKTYWLHINIYLDPSLEEASIDLVKGMRTKLQAGSGFPTEQIYVNYALGDEGAASWWSAANLPRLESLKKLWDPEHLFGAANPIPECE